MPSSRLTLSDRACAPYVHVHGGRTRPSTLSAFRGVASVDGNRVVRSAIDIKDLVALEQTRSRRRELLQDASPEGSAGNLSCEGATRQRRSCAS